MSILNNSEVRQILFKPARTSPDYENFRRVELSHETLRNSLADLALNTLGQHWWTNRVTFPKSEIGPCICELCESARICYQFAIGVWPTREQEEKAMKDWVNPTVKKL